MDKSVVFVDGGYFGKLLKFQFVDSKGLPKKVDYYKLGNIIASKCNSELLRTYYYDSPPYVSPKPTQDEKSRQEGFDKFIYNLKLLDKFEVRLGRLRKYNNLQGQPIFEQKGVDVLLAIDALNLSLKNKISKAIFVTGDSDFVPVIQAIKDEGVEVFLFYHSSAVHRNILQVCDNKLLLDDTLIDNCKFISHQQ